MPRWGREWHATGLTCWIRSGLSEPQYVQFNGGFSQEQLNWLNEVLTFSDTNQEKVVIVSKYANRSFGYTGILEIGKLIHERTVIFVFWYLLSVKQILIPFWDYKITNCIGVWMFAWIYLRILCACSTPRRPEEGVRQVSSVIADSCELTCGCWELDPGPLVEQPVHLIAEPYLQPHWLHFFET